MRQRYRYDWDTAKWVEVFRFRADIVVMNGTMRPDGSLNSFTIPRASALADYYLEQIK